MKASFFLPVLALALTTQAWDHYKYCACTNADGTPNDEITGKICDLGYPRINEQPFLECKHFWGNWVIGAKYGIFKV
ncbi:unnamed protein product [Colletotrichum noveboracense]|uniref:Uncharacterized protein n=1 Tax=Colletotrichum noveboracense TaxID=2664923 RepID=A0A9W4S064_9PEZI|nr:unnamed protein product [Colletotrichum noveboracense]